MANHRVGSYGQTVRVNIGVDLSQFNGQSGRDLTAVISTGGGAYSQEWNFSASTLFVGNSTVYSSAVGVTFTSGQWAWFQPATADAFTSASTHHCHIRASATGQYFITPNVTFEIDA